MGIIESAISYQLSAISAVTRFDLIGAFAEALS